MNFFHMFCVFEFAILRFFRIIKFGKIGKNSIINYGLFSASENINIGEYVYTGENIKIWGEGGLTIGDNTIIGPNVTIRTTNHDYKSGDFLPYGPGIDKRKVTIGKNCWIGDGVYINPGSTIGEGCIIGMGTIVSGNIPRLSVVVGAPTRVIKTRDRDEYNRLNESQKYYLKHKLSGKK